MILIKRQDINLLIDSLIKTGGGQNPYGKMSEILRLIVNSDEIRVLRNTLFLWFDSMNIFSVDFQSFPPKYKINKPCWIPGTIEKRYNLLGALTINEIEFLNKQTIVKKSQNKIIYNHFEIELPDTYYTEDVNSVIHFGFEIMDDTLFNNIENEDGFEIVKSKLTNNSLNISDIEGVKRICFLREDSTPVYIENQDNVQIFDWITRNYYKCNIKEELEDVEGIKLITVEKRFSETHFDKFTLLLEKKLNEGWEYFYFDPKKVDDRWARFVFLSKLTHFDLHRKIDNTQLFMLSQNIINMIDNDLLKIDNLDLERKNIIKIPSEMLKQLIQYDKRKGILALPVSIPLPKIFMKYLFSCSGTIPLKFTNKFSRNPNYCLKVLYSGKISNPGKSIQFPDHSFFMDEDFYLFTCIPDELAQIIEKKIGIKYYKRTFYEII